MTVVEIRERSVKEAEAAREIKDKADEESRGLNEEEALKFDQHLREAERLEQEATRQETLEGIEKKQNAPAERKVNPELANGGRIEVVKPDLFRFGQLRAFKGPKAEANAYISGKWLMATVMGDAAARQWCRDKGVEIRVQTEGVNAAGGFVVPDVMERAVIDLREEYGMFRKYARVIPMTSDHSIIPRRTGGVTAYFVGETTAITASDKSWNQVELTAKKLGALTRMSTDLSEDAIINLADDLAQEMAYAFAAKEDACGLDGDGTNTYGGMVGIRIKMIDGLHLGSYSQAASPGDDWAELTIADLTAVMAPLPTYAKANAKWFCSGACKHGTFDRLALALAGNNAQTIAEGGLPKFMGYPIVEHAAMPSGAGYNGTIMLLFGDLRLSTTFGDRRGITIKVSMERYLEYDQIGIQATERFCIVNHDIGGAAATTYGPMRGQMGLV